MNMTSTNAAAEKKHKQNSIAPFIKVDTSKQDTTTKADVRRRTKSANFFGPGLIAQHNQPTKSVNHDTRPIVLSATSYVIS